MRIYLDNAATSYPKPESVLIAVNDYMQNIGNAIGRGNTSRSLVLQRQVMRTRQQVVNLTGVAEPEHVIFTFNGTDSLNLGLHGLLQPGDHVITSSLEHNSVIRPLRDLQQRIGIQLTIIQPGADGCVEPNDFRAAIRPETRLITLLHASNVTGLVQPIEAVGEIAHESGVLFLVDAAQTAGHLPINLQELPVDLIACSGHKGLLAPLGTGLLLLKPGVEQQLRSMRQGGTGTVSESEQQPENLPEKYEAGNLNAPGILGLSAALDFLSARTIEQMHQHQLERTAQLIEGLRGIDRCYVYHPDEQLRRVGVISITLEGWDPQTLSSVLDENFHIDTRAGLHCAPGAHRALGTLAQGGTLRFSVGAFTTSAMIDQTVDAIHEITKG